MAISDPELEITENLHELIEMVSHFIMQGWQINNWILLWINSTITKSKLFLCHPYIGGRSEYASRRVIIQSLYRYSGEKGNSLISVMEYKQMAGQAGRPPMIDMGK